MELSELKGKKFAVVRKSGTRIPEEVVAIFAPKSRVFDELSYMFLIEDGYEMFDVVLVWEFLDHVENNAVPYMVRRFSDAAKHAALVVTRKEDVRLSLEALGFEETSIKNMVVRFTAQ